MKMPWAYMTFADWLVIITLTLLAGAGIAMVAAAPAGTRVVASTDEQVCFIAALDQPGAVELDGPLGKTTLVIDAEGARITGSPCPRKVCMTMGPARQTGDLLACVPNRILVNIDGQQKRESAYDLLSR